MAGAGRLAARRRPCVVAAALVLGLAISRPAAGQSGTIGEVRVEREGEVVTDPTLLSLIETTVGEPISRSEVRDTIAHFVGLNAFEDVRVEEEPLPSGAVRLRYVLVPAHPVDRVRFEGATGVREDDLRRVILDQAGAAPRAAQADTALDGLFSFSRAPLRISVVAGLAATGLSLLASLALAMARQTDIWLVAALVAGHLVAASLFGAIGALGAYVGRTYEECKARPLYVLKDQIPAAGPAAVQPRRRAA